MQNMYFYSIERKEIWDSEQYVTWKWFATPFNSNSIYDILVNAMKSTAVPL